MRFSASYISNILVRLLLELGQKRSSGSQRTTSLGSEVLPQVSKFTPANLTLFAAINEFANADRT